MFLFLPLQECLEFFNIPETQSSHYFLMDKRWNLIHYNKVRQRSGTDYFVLSISSLFKHQGYLKENRQPISRIQTCRHHMSGIQLCGERWEFVRTGERQKWSPLALKLFMSSFLRKASHNVSQCLEGPAQKFLKRLKGLLFSSN